jgi:hypothetical protein
MAAGEGRRGGRRRPDHDRDQQQQQRRTGQERGRPVRPAGRRPVPRPGRSGRRTRRRGGWRLRRHRGHGDRHRPRAGAGRGRRHRDRSPGRWGRGSRSGDRRGHRCRGRCRHWRGRWRWRRTPSEERGVDAHDRCAELYADQRLVAAPSRGVRRRRRLARRVERKRRERMRRPGAHHDRECAGGEQASPERCHVPSPRHASHDPTTPFRFWERPFAIWTGTARADERHRRGPVSWLSRSRVQGACLHSRSR